MNQIKQKINKIRSKIRSLNVDGILLNDESNIKYIAGYYTQGAMLYIGKKKEAIYFIDPMNFDLCKKSLNCEDINIVTFNENYSINILAYIRKIKPKDIGIDLKTYSASLYKNLTKNLPGIKIISENNGSSIASICEDMRMIKTEDEIKIIRKIAKDTVKIWKQVKKELTPGVTEIKIASIINMLIHEKGYTNSFPTIACVGENTAYPHAIPGKSTLKVNEHVMVDFGVKYRGYCSDLTRVGYKGRISPKIAALEDMVKRSQDIAIKNIKAGVKVKTVVKKAHDVFYNNDCDKYILHGLGHGLGLDIHEKPFLRENSESKLSSNMVITVEPGLYAKGIGGIRIEDMVLVTSKGCEVLTR